MHGPWKLQSLWRCRQSAILTGGPRGAKHGPWSRKKIDYLWENLIKFESFKGKNVMDTTRWKSILVPRRTYDEIVAAAKIEGRTISGHMRIVFEFWKQKNLTKEDHALLDEQVELMKNEKEAIAS